VPRAAHAQSDFWDFIEGFSGPGPFKGKMASFSARLGCIREDAQGEHPIGTCWTDVDPRIKAVFVADYSMTWTGDRPVFSDTPNDIRSITLQKFGVTYMTRLSPILDIGFGGGALVFTNTGTGAVVLPQVTPAAVTFVPFGYLRSNETQRRWGRFFRIKFAEIWVPKEINARKDFASLSGYAKDGDFVRNVSVDFDLGVLIFRDRNAPPGRK
jgi:hypothetical protein